MKNPAGVPDALPIRANHRQSGAMPAALTIAISVAAAILLTACGGGDTYTPSAASVTAQVTTKVLVTLQSEPVGANCETAGSRIQAGLDTNGNGTLDSGEVSSTQFVCNGATGATGAAGTSTLALVTDAGSNCASGGKAIGVGSDTNGNGVLDVGEIVSTHYVCNGASGTNGTNGLNTLLVTIAESAGPNCAWAGMKTTSGLDVNANAVLDSSEITSTTYVCNGQPAVLATPIDVATASFQAASNTSYLADSTSNVAFTLPVSPAVGDLLRISGLGTGGWSIVQNAGQSVYVGFANANWSARISDAPPFIGMSRDGQAVASMPYGQPIDLSLDGGTTWTHTSSDSQYWLSAAFSPDNTHLLIGGYNAGVQASTDSGASWHYTSLPSGSWASLSFAADGLHVAAANSAGGSDGGIWMSVDGGASWSQSGAGLLAWQSVAQSADGSHLVAAESSGSL